MAKTRMVNTRIWNDSWVSNLDPIEKLLFIYCLTNEHTNISGIYELPLKVAAVETGIDTTMFDKVFPRLKPKIYFFQGWVIVPNFPKHQASDQPKVQMGVKNVLALIPSHIKDKAIAYGYPIHSPPMYSDSDLDSNTPYKIVSEKEDGRKPAEKKDTSYLKVFALWGKYPAIWVKNTTQINSANNLLNEHGIPDIKEALEYFRKHKSEQYCPQILSPWDLDTKWLKLVEYSKKNQ